MKKYYLALLYALLSTLLLLTAGKGRAQEYTLKIMGETVTAPATINNVDKTWLAAGWVRVKIENNELVVKLDQSDMGSSMDNMTWLDYKGSLPLKIEVATTRPIGLSGKNSVGIVCDAPNKALTIVGKSDSKLTIVADKGIVVKNDLLLKDLTLDINAKTEGIYAAHNNGTLTFNNVYIGKLVTDRNNGHSVIRGFGAVAPEIKIGGDYVLSDNEYQYKNKQILNRHGNATFQLEDLRHLPGFRGLKLGATYVTATNAANILGDGKASLANNTLTLSGVAIATTGKDAYGFQNFYRNDLTVKLEGENTISTTESDAIALNQSTLLTGSGSLKVVTTDEQASGIKFSSFEKQKAITLTVKDTKLEVKTGGWCFYRATDIANLILNHSQVDLESREEMIVEDGFNSFTAIKEIPTPSYVFEGEIFKAAAGGTPLKKLSFAPDNTQPPVETYPLFICGTQVDENNAAAFTQGVTKGEVSYNKDTKTLTLKDATLEAGEHHAIRNEGIDGLTILLVTENDGKNVWKINNSTENKNSALLIKKNTKIQGQAAAGKPEPTLQIENADIALEGAVTLTLNHIAVEMTQNGKLYGDASKTAKLEVQDFGLACQKVEGLAALSLKGVARILSPKEAQFNSTTGMLTPEGAVSIGVARYPLYFFGIQVTDLNKDNLLALVGGVASETRKAQFTPSNGANPAILSLKGDIQKQNTTPNTSPAIDNQGVENLEIHYEGVVSIKTNFWALQVKSPTFLRAVGTGAKFVSTEGNNRGIMVCGTTLSVQGHVVANGAFQGVYAYDDNGKEAKIYLSAGSKLEAKASHTATGAVSFQGKVAGNPMPTIVSPVGATFNDQYVVVDAANKPVEDLVVLEAPEKEYELYIAGHKVTSQNKDNLGNLDGVTLRNGGAIEFQDLGSRCMLTLRNVTITATGSTVGILSKEELQIRLEGDNKIVAADGVATQFENTITWSGVDGSSLAVSSNAAGVSLAKNVHSVFMESCVCDITSKNETAIKGETGSQVQIKGKVRLKGKEKPMNGVTCSGTSRIVEPLFGTLTAAGVLDSKDQPTNEVLFENVERTFDLLLCGREIHTKNMNSLDKLPGVTVENGGEFRFEATTDVYTLRMKNVKMKCGNTIFINRDGYKLVVEGENSLHAPTGNAITNQYNISLEGAGVLNVVAEQGDALCVKGNINVKDVTLNLKGKKSGITTYETVSISKAIVTLIGTEDGSLYAGGLVLTGVHLANSNYEYNATKKAVVNKQNSEVVKSEVKILRQENYHFYIAGVEITSQNLGTLATLSGVTVKTGGAISYDPATKTLKLKDVDIASTAGAALQNDLDGITIEVEGKCALTAASETLKITKNTKLVGAGTLATGAIAVTEGELSLADLSINVTGNVEGTKAATLSINKASLVVTSSEKPAIQGFGTFTLKDAQIASPEAATWDATQNKLVANGEPVKELTVVAGLFTIAPSKLDIVALGKESDVTVTSEKPWTAETTADWVELSTKTGTGTATIKVGVKENNGDSREATVVFTQEGTGLKATLAIAQKGKKIEITKIEVSPATVELTLTVKESQQLTVKYTPQNATPEAVTWKVTVGEDVVSVDGTGLVKALKAGTAEVTATMGDKTDKCVVTVNEKPGAIEDTLWVGVEVLPNPFTAQLRILNPEELAGHYQLLNALGQVLRSGLLSGKELVVNTEALPAGVYFVRIEAQNGAAKTVKVVK